jgi:hypothetical protein
MIIYLIAVTAILDVVHSLPQKAHKISETDRIPSSRRDELSLLAWYKDIVQNTRHVY